VVGAAIVSDTVLTLDERPICQYLELIEAHRRVSPPRIGATASVNSSPGGTLSGTVEKGVDTAIATDMIRLAWEDAYDIAVLASLDADFIPAVDFLDQKGKKVIQAGFPPKGTDLATACWASFDLFARRDEIRRP
jgi:uncharacterized LabA/DUF88 family protein